MHSVDASVALALERCRTPIRLEPQLLFIIEFTFQPLGQDLDIPGEGIRWLLGRSAANRHSQKEDRGKGRFRCMLRRLTWQLTEAVMIYKRRTARW